MTATELVEQIIHLVDEKKAENITSINVARKSDIADYFVICEGTSTTHVKALADFLQLELKQRFDEVVLRVDGAEEKEWIVLDYGNVLVHVFLPEIRQEFRLEDLWRRENDEKELES